MQVEATPRVATESCNIMMRDLFSLLDHRARSFAVPLPCFKLRDRKKSSDRLRIIFGATHRNTVGVGWGRASDTRDQPPHASFQNLNASQMVPSIGWTLENASGVKGFHRKKGLDMLVFPLKLCHENRTQLPKSLLGPSKY